MPEDSISTSLLAAFEKTSESVVKVVAFKVLTPSRLSLFAGLGCGCVSTMSCLDFNYSLLFWGSLSEIFKEV